MKNPHQDRRKTRPYILKGLRAGMDFAFSAVWLEPDLLTGSSSEPSYGGRAYD